MATQATVTVDMMIEHQPVQQPRHEIKFVISGQEAYLLSERLKRLFRRDSHGDTEGRYRVSSLYFDDLYDSALREKLDGRDNRQKFRLRYYGFDTSYIRLEKKQKQRGLCRKYSFGITGDMAEKLIFQPREHFHDMEKASPLIREFCLKRREGLLRPRKTISYEREAFIFDPGNVRVTIDRNIRAADSYQHFLCPELKELPVAGEDCILEVKYDRFLPELVSMALSGTDRLSTACSKYALAFRYD